MKPSLRRRRSKPSVYTNGLDECVGRLQRRLRKPYIGRFLLRRRRLFTSSIKGEISKLQVPVEQCMATKTLHNPMQNEGERVARVSSHFCC